GMGMFINQLQLKNYRNYQALDITFDNKVNVIIGENAQGKTNLLEAIYLLAFTKSYRTTHDRELIRWDEEFAKISGRLVKKEERTVPLELIFHKAGKKAKLNHLEQNRLSDYIGAMNVVMFAPEDLSLVKGSPQVRRRFIDMELGQIEPLYLYHLTQYQKLLKQRNHMLKKLQYDKGTDITFLHILTEQLIKHAAIILKKRFDFLTWLRKWAHPIHYEISREEEDLKIVYDASVEVKYSEDFQRIEQNDIKSSTTLVRPHRDDLNFYNNKQDLKLYRSQGKQRTTALSLKLAEIDLIYEQIGAYPILLLDYVL